MLVHQNILNTVLFVARERSAMFWLSTFLIGAFVVLYLYLTRNYKYWQKCGIPSAIGALPGIGHMLGFCMNKSFAECCRKIYHENRNHSMVGFYNFTTPSLMILEPELVKTVLQTNFTSFSDNGNKVDPELDPLLAYNPFFSNGDKWMMGRKRLTNAFSNVRLKILFEVVKQTCEKFDNYLHKKLSKTGKIEVELKELFAKFTGQVVSGAGFGVDGLCFEEGKEHESFHTMGKSFLEPSTFNTIISTLTFFMPSLGKLFRIRFLPKKADQFFRTLVDDVMKQRRTDGKSRNDFLQLMADLERTEGTKFENEVLAAHAVSFFIDGYESSSSTLSFVGYQLATHPKVQKKLRDEVIRVLEKYDGEVTFEALKDMTYMDQVLNESQRIVHVIGYMWKICTKECELRGSDGLVCRVQPGTDVIIPVYGLQEDPRYWENPDMFDPERFSPEKKQSIEKFAFLPFGEGPRMCVGMRMALLQMKACLATLLKSYKLELSPKTQTPLQMTPGTFLITPKGGLWTYIQQV